MENLTIGAITELIKKTAPEAANSIMMDNAVAVKRYDYCYANVYAQRVEFKSERRSAAIGPELEQRLVAVAQQMGDSPYQRLDGRGLIEEMEQAPKYANEGFFSNAKKRVSELMNGGRDVDMHHVTLDTTADGHLRAQQPAFAIKDECGVADCPNCQGRGLVERTDKQHNRIEVECPACKGLRRIGTLSYIVPKVNEKKVRLVRCLEGEVENLKFDIGADGLTLQGTDFHIADTEPEQMLTHFNGVDSETFDDTIRPYLDTIRDKIGEHNNLIDISYHIIPCYTFAYRNVVTGAVRRGVLVAPQQQPTLLLELDGTGRKILSGVRDSAKSVSRFFGALSKSSSFKDKEDLRRSTRLLIAIAVADGTVGEEEKQSLTLAIRNMNLLTSSEQEELVKLLSAKDGSFLTDDDFRFHSHENAEETLARMQEIAGADGEVDETERDIMEKLKLSI